MSKVALAAICAAFFVMPASAATVELIKNGSFEINSVGPNQRALMETAGLADWTFVPDTIGSKNLVAVVAPGMADDPSDVNSVYPGFPETSPNGGDFIQGDGDPFYSMAFSQVIDGLTVGQSYELNFWQAAGQQSGMLGATTEWWNVTFGDETRTSSVFSLPEGGFAPWEQQTMTFVATSASQTLTFLAGGTPGGAPPMAFLDGVSMLGEVPAVPEPATWAMMVAGFGMVGFAARRRGRTTLSRA